MNLLLKSDFAVSGSGVGGGASVYKEERGALQSTKPTTPHQATTGQPGTKSSLIYVSFSPLLYGTTVPLGTSVNNS